MSGGGRPLDQRLALMSPALTRLANRGMMRLRPGSALRRRALKRWVRFGFEGLSSGDHALIDLLIVDEYRLILRGEAWEVVGLHGEYRGHEGWRHFLALWEEAIGATRYEPLQVIDLGDRIVVQLEITARGVASDVPVSVVSGYVYTLAGGVIVRHEAYYDWNQCARALGLPAGGR
jgi:ketosteroid isomerase-like protein